MSRLPRASDIAEALVILDENIAHLDATLEGAGESRLRQTLAPRRDRLQRARDWMAETFDAMHQPAANAHGCPHPGCHITDGQPCAYEHCPNRRRGAQDVAA